MKQLIDQLCEKHYLSKEEYSTLLAKRTEECKAYLFAKSAELAIEQYGKKVFFRGLIEISSYCKNDCYYCGIRCSNRHAGRYRLTKEQILNCCAVGYDLGFRTFVLQGGEDPYFTDERLVEIVGGIRTTYPDCAITLSLGERSRESYQALFDAGANRYLLRHESANPQHYQRLHPANLSLENRIRCLHDLKAIGYQVGCGFMVGSPFQTLENLVEDLLFIQSFKPHMVGIGPFIAHHDTPFKQEKAGSLELSLFMLALVRLIQPAVLLPATTALGSIDESGREKGILVGANVVMPNLSPPEVRASYSLYDNKLSLGAEASEGMNLLRSRVEAIGYSLAAGRGDHKERSNVE